MRLAGAGVTKTWAVWGTCVLPFTVAMISLVPAIVDAKVPTATPSFPVGCDGCVRVLPLPLAVSVTTAPGTGSPAASRTVTRIVATLPTGRDAGSTDTVETAELGTVPVPLPPPPTP